MSQLSRRSFIGAATLGIAGAGLAGCGATGTGAATTSAASAQAAPDGQTQKFIVFAAASMTESLTKIGDVFKGQNDGVEISFNYDSSGTLATQIKEGSECDVFISAGQKQMNALDASAEKDPGAEALIDHDTRFNILENKVTLAVPEGNPKSVENFEDMAKKLKKQEILLAMGNSDVPVGQYTQKILKYFDLDEKSLADSGHITYGTNVKEVTTQVKEAAVDCGVIYKTDATSAGLTTVDEATEQMCGRVVYPAAIVATSKQKELAAKFLDFCKSNDASIEFEQVGFTPLAED